MPELVSILMPAYNAERYIASAIESALHQSYANWELLVVDDGSTDRTAEILSGCQDARTRVFHQANGGESAARNTALANARGKYIAFLDADDAYLPDHLERAVDYLESHPEHGGVYTDGFYVNEAGERIKQLSARRRGPFEGDIFDAMVRASDVFGAPVCVVLRHEPIVRHAIQFDRAITIGPDWDFLTAFSQWSTFGRIGHPTCLYRIHQNNITLQTGTQKRLDSLVRCREKAIRMERFGECTPETREFVFYDLMMNLLSGNTTRQEEISTWPEFTSLPTHSQAAIFRQIAAKAVLSSQASGGANTWFRRAQRLAPQDLRTRILYTAYQIHPGFCRMLLRARNTGDPSVSALRPLADLAQGEQKAGR